MTEVLFYHLQKRSLDEVLPDLLERTLQRGWRAVVLVGVPDRLEPLNAQLWMYRREAFLPHGSRDDGQATRQPIWLTDRPENPNGAQVLFLVDGAEADSLAGWTRVCDIFDGNDDAAVAAARARWARAKAEGHTLAYWQQTERGGWEKKAEG